MKVKVKFSKNFRQLEKALKTSPRIVKKHMTRATAFIGKKGESLAREEISHGKYEPNRPLTVSLKGGRNEPLIGDRPGSPLFKAITSKVINFYTVFIGILQTNQEYNIARTIHDGKVINVTSSMRGLFYVLWLKEKDPSVVLEGRAKELWEKMPGGWMPLKKETEKIVIPSRPFIDNIWIKGDIQKVAKKFWNEAIEASFKEMKQS